MCISSKLTFPSFPGRRALGALVGLVGLVGPILAQEADSMVEEKGSPPADLLSARTLFFEAILNDSQLLTEQYGRALGKAEQAAAGRGDYEEALRIKARSQDLKAIYKGEASTLVESEAIQLAPEEAQLNGGVEVLRGSLEGWRSTASYAEWRGVTLEPGEYYLEFDAAMVAAPLIAEREAVEDPEDEPVEEAGFEFFEVSLLPGATDNRRGFDVKASADGATFESYRVGPIEYPRSPVTLRLAPQDAFPLNIIRVQNVRLVGKGVEDAFASESVEGAPSPKSVRPLNAIRMSLRDSLLEVYQAAAKDYVGQLRSWAGGVKGRKSVLNAELESLKVQMAALRDNAGAAPSLMGILGGFGGFEDISQAMYVKGSATSGHEFEFLSEDGRHRVRLFGVRCMPLDAEDASLAADAEYFAKHFGVSKEDASSLGVVAKEFATGYLEGKMIRLLVQPARSVANGKSPFALVFVPDVGLFQNVLVDQGLAAVRSEDAKRLKGAMPKAVIGSLEARETAARERTQPPGGWALQAEGGASR